MIQADADSLRAPMDKTFSTLGCVDLDLDEVAALAHRHGITTLELRALGGEFDLPAWLAARYGTPAAWADRLRELGVTVRVLATSHHLIDGDAASLAALERFIPWAEAAEVPWLRVFDGGQTGDAAEIARGAASLAAWQKKRTERGLQCDWAIETHDSLFTSERLRALFATAPGVRLLWDTHHTWRKGGEHPLTTWPTVAAHTVHLHIKDSISQPSAQHPFTYVPPGEGEFPFPTLRSELEKSGYTGALGLEWERKWHPYLAPVDVALTAATRHGWW